MILKGNIYRLVILVYNFEHLIKVVHSGFQLLTTALWYNVCLKSELTSIA